jgi:transposase
MKTAINQVVLPLNLGYKIPKNDPVYLVNEICEELNYSKLYNQYVKHWRKHSPKTLFKILVYAYLRKIYSGRAIEEACRRDICFMYLLNFEPVPDNSTISRFQNEKLTEAMEDLFYQLIQKLHEKGEILFENLFVDGTKIEAYANRYTFVWEKAVKKNAEKLRAKIEAHLMILSEKYMQKFTSVEQCYAILAEKSRLANLEFVHGKGKRKTPLQRDIEQTLEYLERMEKYKEYFASFKGRKSFSKTDKDATFMRMKEDHMRNGQLKPAYNVQIGVESEYIVGISLFPNPTDVNTLIPFLDRIKTGTRKIIKNIIADAGYESEENYVYLKENKQTAYIKPQNYEISKKRAYKKDKFKVEHLEYNKEQDCFVCPENRELKYVYTSQTESCNGYKIAKKVYQNESCEGCPHYGKCHKSKNGYRTIKVSHRFAEERENSLKNITTEEGILLRMNRSIQVEGAFGVIKEDYRFRRFLTRGKPKTETQFFLLSFAFNVQKYFNKSANDRLKTELIKKEIT